MNEEISKDIKELIKNCKLWVENDDIDYTRWFGLHELNILLDYITNLQTIEQHYSQILSENAELRIDISVRETICDDYKSRINKVINFLKNLRDTFDKSDEMYELLDEAISLLQESEVN